MKKKGKLLVVVSLMVCVAFLVAGSVAPAVAARGAVKGDLYVAGDPTNVVGQVIVTPTGANKIEVTAQVRDSSVTSAKSCTLYAGIESPWGTSLFKINAKGNGSGHVSYDTTGFSGLVKVQVSIWEPDTEGPHLYSAIVWVTLK